MDTDKLEQHLVAIEQMLKTHTCELFAILSILSTLPETSDIQLPVANHITENLVSASPNLQAMSKQITERVAQIVAIAKTQQAIQNQQN